MRNNAVTLLLGLMAVGLLTSFSARAEQQGNSPTDQADSASEDCPDGAWICDEPSDQAQSPTRSGGEEDYVDSRRGTPRRVIRHRSANSPGAPAGHGSTRPETAPGYPPPDSYYPPGPPVPPPPPPPPPRPRYRWRTWGANLHLAGVGLGAGAVEGAGMGGFGLALRYRPIRHFAMDVAFDFITGTDYQGFSRWETPAMINGFFYINPRNATQFYFLAGLGWSTARVSLPASGTQAAWVDHYAYFGAQMGLGLEFRVTHLISINTDLIGFMRNRIDSGAALDPEFVDPDTGVATNASGGALLRVGGTVYW